MSVDEYKVIGKDVHNKGKPKDTNLLMMLIFIGD